MTDITYEGFSNYATWTVSLWIDGAKHTFDYWREEAVKHWRQAATSHEVTEGKWTRHDIACRDLAEQLKDSLSDDSQMKDATVYTHLLNAAISDVDWCEIAQHLMADAQEREGDSNDLFGPIISAYTRAQAIEDGVLVDVSEMAKEAGITHPTAVTCAVWHEFVEVPEDVDCQDEQGRLWDILNMYRFSAKQSAGNTQLLFKVKVRNDNRAAKPVTLKAICGPGDTAAPVLTIMLPDED